MKEIPIPDQADDNITLQIETSDDDASDCDAASTVGGKPQADMPPYSGSSAALSNLLRERRRSHGSTKALIASTRRGAKRKVSPAPSDVRIRLCYFVFIPA